MKRTPKGAAAPKFLVISDSQYYTTYTGTRDQLISLGVARPEQFPEGRKRVQYFAEPGPDAGLRIEKKKGGRLEVMKWHPRRSPVQSAALKQFSIYPRPDVESGYGITVHLPGSNPDDVRDELNELAGHIVDIANRAQRDARRKRLSLIPSPRKFHFSNEIAAIREDEQRGSKQ